MFNLINTLSSGENEISKQIALGKVNLNKSQVTDYNACKETKFIDYMLNCAKKEDVCQYYFPSDCNVEEAYVNNRQVSGEYYVFIADVDKTTKVFSSAIVHHRFPKICTYHSLGCMRSCTKKAEGFIELVNKRQGSSQGRGWKYSVKNIRLEIHLTDFCFLVFQRFFNSIGAQTFKVEQDSEKAKNVTKFVHELFLSYVENEEDLADYQCCKCKTWEGGFTKYNDKSSEFTCSVIGKVCMNEFPYNSNPVYVKQLCVDNTDLKNSNKSLKEALAKAAIEKKSLEDQFHALTIRGTKSLEEAPAKAVSEKNKLEGVTSTPPSSVPPPVLQQRELAARILALNIMQNSPQTQNAHQNMQLQRAAHIILQPDIRHLHQPGSGQQQLAYNGQQPDIRRLHQPGSGQQQLAGNAQQPAIRHIHQSQQQQQSQFGMTTAEDHNINDTPFLSSLRFKVQEYTDLSCFLCDTMYTQRIIDYQTMGSWGNRPIDDAEKQKFKGAKSNDICCRHWAFYRSTNFGTTAGSKSTCKINDVTIESYGIGLLAAFRDNNNDAYHIDVTKQYTYAGLCCIVAKRFELAAAKITNSDFRPRSLYQGNESVVNSKTGRTSIINSKMSALKGETNGWVLSKKQKNRFRDDTLIFFQLYEEQLKNVLKFENLSTKVDSVNIRKFYHELNLACISLVEARRFIETYGASGITLYLEDERYTTSQQSHEKWRSMERMTSLMRVIDSNEELSIRNAIYGSPQGREILFQCGTDSITGENLNTLKPGEWLNDEVIHFYYSLLEKRDEELCKEYPSRQRSHFAKSFFFTKLLNSGSTSHENYEYSCQKQWSNNIPGKDIFKLDKFFFPINVSFSHWIVAVIFMKKKRIEMFDSKDGKYTKYLDFLFRYIQDEHIDKKKTILPDIDEWELVPTQPTTPGQDNGTYD
jgi:hypothetical protein